MTTRLRSDGTVVQVTHYSRLAEKAWGKIEEESMLESMEVEEPEHPEDSFMEKFSKSVERYFTLGVNASALIELVGEARYHAEFAELDADQRYSALLKELGL